MTSQPPLGLRYKHKEHEGIPLTAFVTPARIDEILNKHKSRDSDVYVATYQKCGTTWLSQVLCLMYDFPQGKQANIMFDVPWLEKESNETIEKALSPRIMKTHLKWRWLPKDSCIKYIYCYRNPKDVAVSYYHHMLWRKDRNPFHGTFDDFMTDVFLAENGSENGNYFDHVAEWLEQKENKNILYVTYEDMSENIEREVRRIAAFLGMTLSDEKLKLITAGSSFEAMKNNECTNYSWFPGSDPKCSFIRKGKVGDWINYLSTEQSLEIEKQVEIKLTPHKANIRYKLG